MVFEFTKDDVALWPQDWYDGVREIAAKAPKLTFMSGERYVIIVLILRGPFIVNFLD